MSNYICYKVWDKVTYPFPNFNCCTIVVLEWISEFKSQFTGALDSIQTNEMICLLFARRTRTIYITKQRQIFGKRFIFYSQNTKWIMNCTWWNVCFVLFDCEISVFIGFNGLSSIILSCTCNALSQNKIKLCLIHRTFINPKVWSHLDQTNKLQGFLQINT